MPASSKALNNRWRTGSSARIKMQAVNTGLTMCNGETGRLDVWMWSVGLTVQYRSARVVSDIFGSNAKESSCPPHKQHKNHVWSIHLSCWRNTCTLSDMLYYVPVTHNQHSVNRNTVVTNILWRPLTISIQSNGENNATLYNRRWTGNIKSWRITFVRRPQLGWGQFELKPVDSGSKPTFQFNRLKKGHIFLTTSPWPERRSYLGDKLTHILPLTRRENWSGSWVGMAKVERVQGPAPERKRDICWTHGFFIVLRWWL